MNTQSMDKARFNMAEQQIRPWDVTDDQVLETLQQVPREKYVPREYRGVAFADLEIPLENGQSMMPPRLEARMLQALAIKPSDHILEIGTGSGFITACLAELGNSVTSYEIDETLANQAQEKLTTMGVNNAHLHTGDALAFDFGDNSYDVIAVTGSMPLYDDRLDALLAPGGRMFVVTGEQPVMQAILVTKDKDGACHQQNMFETELAPLKNTRSASTFMF